MCKCVFGYVSFYFVGWLLNFCCASIVRSLSLSIWHSFCARRHRTVCGEKRASNTRENNVYLFVCFWMYVCACVRVAVYGEKNTGSEWKQKYINKFIMDHIYIDIQRQTKYIHTVWRASTTNKQAHNTIVCTQTLAKIYFYHSFVLYPLYILHLYACKYLLVYESEHSTNKIIFRFVSSLAVFGSVTFSQKWWKITTHTKCTAYAAPKPLWFHLWFGLS